MPGARMSVERTGPDEYRIRITDRGTLDEAQVEKQLKQVYESVNEAAALPPSDSAAYRELYQSGPVLFRVNAMTADRGSSERIGGLKVSSARLEATIQKLEAFGFEVAR